MCDLECKLYQHVHTKHKARLGVEYINTYCLLHELEMCPHFKCGLYSMIEIFTVVIWVSLA